MKNAKWRVFVGHILNTAEPSSRECISKTGFTEQAHLKSGSVAAMKYGISKTCHSPAAVLFSKATCSPTETTR